MAIIGLILLVGSVFLAVAAPILTPYDPQKDIVSGILAQPAWVMNFPDGYYLSQNVLAVNDPSFSSPSSAQAWTLDAPSTAQQNLVLSYSNAAPPGSSGSLQLSYLGTDPANATVSTTFSFPYHGPPQSFIGTIQLLMSGANATTPIHIRLFIDRLGDQSFTLWSQNITSSNGWLTPPFGQNAAYTSESDQVKIALGMQSAPYSPAQIIFSSLQKYSIGVQFIFYGPQKVNISNFQLKLLGTAWGLLGTDSNGNDVVTQVLYGGQTSLTIGLVAAGIGIGLGLVIGLVSGFLGGIIDQVLMRGTDMVLVIPQLPLLLVLIAVLGPSYLNIILVIGFFSWMGFARIIRSQVLTLKERPFVEAAKAAGSGTGRIITRHIFPNIVSLTYVNLALTVPAAIITEAALGFLGLFDPSVPSWGHMFFTADTTGGLTRWWWVLPPGIGIAAVSLSFILIGYALDEIFNPKLRQRR